GVGGGETVGQRAQARGGGGRERRELDDAGFGGELQQPFDFHPDPRVDQPELGKDGAQCVDLGGITAVQRGQGEELGVWHGRGRRRWAINSKRWRRYARAVAHEGLHEWPGARAVPASNTTAWASWKCLPTRSGARRPSARCGTSRFPGGRCRAGSSVPWAWSRPLPPRSTATWACCRPLARRRSARRRWRWRPATTTRISRSTSTRPARAPRAT